jgi:hypothetical protein
MLEGHSFERGSFIGVVSFCCLVGPDEILALVA